MFLLSSLREYFVSLTPSLSRVLREGASPLIIAASASAPLMMCVEVGLLPDRRRLIRRRLGRYFLGSSTII